MSASPKKPKLLLNFILSLLIIVIAFSIDRYYEHQKAQQTDAATTVQQNADTLAAPGKALSRVGQEALDTISDTAAFTPGNNGK